MANSLSRLQRFAWVVGCTACSLLLSCEEATPPGSASEAPADAPKDIPNTTEPAEPSGPPDFHIDTIGAKVGHEQALLDKPQGLEDLRQALNAVKEHIANEEVKLRVDRQAKISHVVTYIDELAKLGADKVAVRTETRPEYPTELSLIPLADATNAQDCSVVAMILDDRSTAVWRLKGGTASRRAKGMAGPDLTMTGDTITRLAKGCKSSEAFFFSAKEGVGWGLLYDLAASTHSLKTRFSKLVLLAEPPVPGHPVEL